MDLTDFAVGLVRGLLAAALGWAIARGIDQHRRQRAAEDRLVLGRPDVPSSTSHAGGAMGWNRIGRYRGEDGTVVRAVLWDQSRAGANAIRRLGVPFDVPARLGPAVAHTTDHHGRSVPVPPNHWVVTIDEQTSVTDPDTFARRFRAVR